MVHDIDHFEMRFNHGQIKSTSKRDLTVYLLLYWDYKLVSGNYDLYFHYWEASLIERRSILAKYDLTFFRVFFSSVVECECRNGKILLTLWDEFSFLIFRPRSHYDELLFTAPHGCHYV